MSLRSLAAKPTAVPSVFGDFFEPWNDWFSDARLSKALTVPKVNITEDEDKYNVAMAVPGMKKSDFKITVDKDVLSISSETSAEKEEKEDKFTRREYNYSSFARSFALPEHVAKDKIEATYVDGELKVVLPKVAKNEVKPNASIEVK